MKLQKIEYMTCGLETDPIMHSVKRSDQNGCWMLNHRSCTPTIRVPQHNETLRIFDAESVSLPQ